MVLWRRFTPAGSSPQLYWEARCKRAKDVSPLAAGFMFQPSGFSPRERSLTAPSFAAIVARKATNEMVMMFVCGHMAETTTTTLATSAGAYSRGASPGR
jgi:hypothetical protein